MFAAPDPQVALDAARGRWKDAAIADYRFHVQRSCYCPAPYTRRYRIRVKAGKAVDAPQAIRSFATVTKLFAVVQESIDGDGTVEVEYGRRGVPLSIGADPLPMAIDDEFSIRAGGLRRSR